MSIVDPRENISHSLEIGQVYTDGRSGDDVLLVYLDSSIAILRDRDDNHRLIRRRSFESSVGANRFKLQPNAEPFGETGRLSRVLKRAEEYEELGGRKNNHYAEAMREAVAILTDQGADDARETVEFEEVSGVGETTASNLRAAGYRTRGDVRGASDEELHTVDGVGESNLEAIREHVG